MSVNKNITISAVSIHAVSGKYSSVCMAAFSSRYNVDAGRYEVDRGRYKVNAGRYWHIPIDGHPCSRLSRGVESTVGSCNL